MARRQRRRRNLLIQLQKMVEVYAELAELLFMSLFGIELPVPLQRETELLRQFLEAWSRVEVLQRQLKEQQEQQETSKASAWGTDARSDHYKEGYAHGRRETRSGRHYIKDEEGNSVRGPEGGRTFWSDRNGDGEHHDTVYHESKYGSKESADSHYDRDNSSFHIRDEEAVGAGLKKLRDEIVHGQTDYRMVVTPDLVETIRKKEQELTGRIAAGQK
jgi:hypothetical protein